MDFSKMRLSGKSGVEVEVDGVVDDVGVGGDVSVADLRFGGFRLGVGLGSGQVSDYDEGESYEDCVDVDVVDDGEYEAKQISDLYSDNDFKKDEEIKLSSSFSGVGESFSSVGDVGDVEVVSGVGGVGEKSTKVDVSSLGVDVGGFDDLLDEFLSGDDEVVCSGEVRVVEVLKPVLPERDRVVVEKKRGRSLVGRERGVKDREVNRVKKYSRTTKYRRSLHGLDSEIGKQGAIEYVVDENGVATQLRGEKVTSADEFDRLVRAAESHSRVGVSKDFAVEASSSIIVEEQKGFVIYPWSRESEVKRTGVRDGRSKKKMNQRELDVFRNLQVSKSELLVGDEVVKRLRKPSFRVENSREVRARKVAVRAGTVGHAGYSRKSGGGVTYVDLEVLQFLGRFRYATAKHLSRIRGVKEVTMGDRLKRLKMKGLVDTIPLYATAPLWVLTDAGMIFAGIDLPIVKPNTLSLPLIPHQFAVNNTAANLMGGNVNVLRLGDFPSKNRRGFDGKLLFGEELVSETEIQSSFGKMRQLNTSDIYRPQIIGNIDREFKDWEDAGGVVGGYDSPEMFRGNEYMWIMFPGSSVGINYHVPDLVLKRPRNADGSPESIAIEIELETKGKDRYVSTLKSYMNDYRIYKKVIWVCKNLQPAKAIEQTAKDIGLYQEGRLEIVPVITENGIFEGREAWNI